MAQDEIREDSFSQRDVELATKVIATLPYFPQEEKAAVMEELIRMVPHKEALDWLILQVRTKMTRWYGLKELRGVLCWKYEPADGHDALCAETAGFTPLDGEAKSIEVNQEHKRLSESVGRKISGILEMKGKI